uniref:Prefoldin subunit 3 n=1 Tax=Trichuris muris TaxID=70415 RepID=A0A5S6QHQ8_TRIMR
MLDCVVVNWYAWNASLAEPLIPVIFHSLRDTVCVRDYHSPKGKFIFVAASDSVGISLEQSLYPTAPWARLTSSLGLAFDRLCPSVRSSLRAPELLQLCPIVSGRPLEALVVFYGRCVHHLPLERVASLMTSVEDDIRFSSVPVCKLIEDVDSYITLNGEGLPKLAIQRFESSMEQYKDCEERLREHRARLLLRKEEIAASLKLCDLLEKAHKESRNVNTQFPLCDNVQVRATVPPTDRVILMLGASTMVEFTFDEARAHLRKETNRLTSKVAEFESRLDFLREQITVMELNVARIRNYVILRAPKSEKALS